MTLAIGIVLTVLAAVFVALPLLRRDDPDDEPHSQVPPSERDRLERQKAEAYTAIKEAEFDYRMGKLSDVDFSAQREKFSAQALEAIAALDVKRASRQSGEGRRPVRIAFCPACGHTVPPRGNFCPACGRSLKEAVA